MNAWTTARCFVLKLSPKRERISSRTTTRPQHVFQFTQQFLLLLLIYFTYVMHLHTSGDAANQNRRRNVSHVCVPSSCTSHLPCSKQRSSSSLIVLRIVMVLTLPAATTSESAAQINMQTSCRVQVSSGQHPKAMRVLDENSSTIRKLETTQITVCAWFVCRPRHLPCIHDHRHSAVACLVFDEPDAVFFKLL